MLLHLLPRRKLLRLRLRRLPYTHRFPNLRDRRRHMARRRIEQADGRHPRARGVVLRSDGKVAQRLLCALAQGLERVDVDLGAVPPWSPLEGADVLDDGGDGVHDGLHWREDARGSGRAARSEQAVDSGDERGDVQVQKATIWSYRKLIVDFGRLQEQLGGS